ncbi:signal peptidase I [Xylanimonas cellulosilytica DSM 15894]|uniref:Signal peptidase I n=1 Tax=Xylanimonas cellulosilytica (strain DSM 15894 / JCM 12276 / CECT 5975 / KCTC 9989 / LMG 20990 / NBRC 107835 / XIL07) TaxID=446471 RepID=D1BZP9_XYLCX|nr:signal peptidase I [Xylanimonas cellulosilytica]ACZ30203.1 signal peptidase I [Xylanimonas cellulosilytica DSM 15894]
MTESDPVTHPQPMPDPSPDGIHHAGLGTGRPAAHASGNGRPGAASRGLGLLRETAIIVVSALVLSWLIKTLLVQAFYIPSPSMYDTLVEGDRVMVSRLVPRVLDIHRGDIVVFKDPGGWLDPYVPPDHGPIGNAVVTGLTAVGLMPQDTGEHLIKRVIGLPGDHVTCCDADGQVDVNGVAITETPYLRPGQVPSKASFDVVVPDGMLFVLGDNRGDSADSRAHLGNPGGGFVPVDNVVGTAFATVWPFPRATWHRNPGDVFEQVPAP